MLVLKGALAKIFVKKILCLKVEERLRYNFKTNISYFKNISVGMHLKQGIDIYLLAGK